MEDDDATESAEISPGDGGRNEPGSEKAKGEASKQVALPGTDGERAERLLESSKRLGVATLGTIAKAAITRLVNSGNPLKAKRLFNPAEQKQLAESLAATVATANLLGRSRIRLRFNQSQAHYDKHDDGPFTQPANRLFITGKVEKHAEEHVNFSDIPTDFTRFDDPVTGQGDIKPMPPEKALEYFRRLVPGLMSDPSRLPLFAAAQRRLGFQLAVTTDETLLGKVQDIIRKTLETGEGKSVKDIQSLLDEAGVSPKNPSYVETAVYRTNIVDALNTGADEERQDPAIADWFPVFRYSGIRDGRQRPAHQVHFNKYYSNSLTFAEVRDSVKGEFDGFG